MVKGPGVCIGRLFRPELIQEKKITPMLKKIDSLNSDQRVWNGGLS